MIVSNHVAWQQGAGKSMPSSWHNPPSSLAATHTHASYRMTSEQPHTSWLVNSLLTHLRPCKQPHVTASKLPHCLPAKPFLLPPPPRCMRLTTLPAGVPHMTPQPPVPLHFLAGMQLPTHLQLPARDPSTLPASEPLPPSLTHTDKPSLTHTDKPSLTHTDKPTCE
jgi:hypothetical protein